LTTGLYSPSCAPVFCNDLALGDAVMYEVVKFLHVFIAIIWIGGAFGAIFVGTLAHRRSDTAAVLSTVRNISIMAKFIFMPASVVLLVLGAILVWEAWSFFDAWVVIGIIGVVLTGLIGALILTPMVEQVTAASDDAVAAPIAARLLQAARADQVLLAVVVWDMVSKPNWSDFVEIAVMAIIVAVAAAPIFRK
jgi:uncharacterized membrane protein